MIIRGLSRNKKINIFFITDLVLHLSDSKEDFRKKVFTEERRVITI
jgi:hypothetical protein